MEWDDTVVRAETALRAGEAERGFEFDVDVEGECVGYRAYDG